MNKMKTAKSETKENGTKPYNIVVPFNIPGKPDIGLLDLNKIFQVNFNYNFDSLKILLDGLISSYKKTEEELENLRAYNKVKDKKIKDMEQNMIDLNILLNNTLGKTEEVEKLKELKQKLSEEDVEEEIKVIAQPKKNIEKKEEKEVKEEKEEKTINASDESLIKKKSSKIPTKKRKKIHAPINKDVKLDIQIGNDDLINKIIKKVNGSEICLNDLFEAVPLLQKEQDNNIEMFNNVENELYELQSKIFNLYEENNSTKKKFEETEEKFKDIDLKMQDFNIIDILRSNSGEDGDMNIALTLISNLEKKLVGKIKLLEDKITKIDSSSFKVEKESQNIKNSQNLNKRQIEQLKKQIEEINAREDMINKTIEQNNEDINDKLESRTSSLEKYIKDSLDNLQSLLDNKLSNIKEGVVVEKDSPKNVINSEELQTMNLENKNALNSLKEAIIEINKKIKTFFNQNDFDQIKSDISALKSGMSNYTLIPDFREVRDVSEENKANIRKLREEFEDWQGAQTENSEIVNIKRKLESISNKVHDIIENYINKKGEKSTYKPNENDKYKFIDYKLFEEFKTHIAKEFNNINDNFINSRKLLDELIDSVRNRTSFKDLKALEDAIMSKMEDLKNTFAKKFADKTEVNRVMKYLDQQIRNIIQIYIKKIEKGDNWLLSKKPISSNLCASCESYIGDIKDGNNNTIHVPWNKYPVKDPNDKLYRMGNGYSKMLQMIQVDENEKKNIGNNNANFTKTDYDFSDFSTKKMKTISGMNKTTQKSLPKLKRKKMKPKVSSTDSDNNINLNDESEDGDEDPKITKIFRLSKEPH
jgi:hypothetical protein